MDSLTGLVVVWGAIAFAVAGCNGQVNGSGAGGSGGSGGGSQAGGAGGTGGAGVCEEIDEELGFTITTSDGVVHACSELTNGDVTFDGAITASTGSASYTIDSCSPDANCQPMLNTLEVVSSTLDLAIPVGTVVSVAAHFSHVGGICNASLYVKNLAIWGGQPNPTSSDEAPWLDSGGPGSPFERSTQVRCTYGEGGDPPCTGGTSVYDLSFALTSDPSVWIGPIMSGTTVTWDVPSGPAAGRYAVRNVQANSGYCEIPGTVEYFIARDLP